MKKLILLGAYLLALAAPMHAMAGPPDIVVVRIREFSTSATAVITRGEGKSELVEIDTKGNFNKEFAQVSEAYHKLFYGLYQEGYTLQSTMSTSASQSTGGVITLLFTKAQ
ncbi:hypothetical protein GO988_18900 [Hymenobacter sp. HMF4947]|uniref:Uncharacterized protein n=1 Tax=Hymenobacter ginkgonis TaxID=2682976 RepID=A0A7K1TJ36_9BACT|nr:hypothetical protein [Hymenobacter ginkgonis]MVN78404.1 hypothetical protein [Hymenobacter ginkgonis]